MSKVFTALSRHLTPLPIVKPDFANGIKITATNASEGSSPQLERGAYLISVGAEPVFFTTDGFASDDFNSIYMSPGTLHYFAIEPGSIASVLAVDANASVYLIPLS